MGVALVFWYAAPTSASPALAIVTVTAFEVEATEEEPEVELESSIGVAWLTPEKPITPTKVCKDVEAQVPWTV